MIDENTGDENTGSTLPITDENLEQIFIYIQQLPPELFAPKHSLVNVKSFYDQKFTVYQQYAARLAEMSDERSIRYIRNSYDLLQLEVKSSYERAMIFFNFSIMLVLVFATFLIWNPLSGSIYGFPISHFSWGLLLICIFVIVAGVLYKTNQFLRDNESCLGCIYMLSLAKIMLDHQSQNH